MFKLTSFNLHTCNIPLYSDSICPYGRRRVRYTIPVHPWHGVTVKRDDMAKTRAMHGAEQMELDKGPTVGGGSTTWPLIIVLD